MTACAVKNTHLKNNDKKKNNNNNKIPFPFVIL